MDRTALEAGLAQLPILQYEFISTSELTFSERVRRVCEAECPMYGRSWACPPGVGSVEDCIARCRAYPEALLLTTAAEVRDVTDMEETLSTRAAHEEITRQAAALVREQASETMVLSTEACAVCEECAWPKGKCRHPEKMFPCVESHGIIATDIAEKHGIEFFNGNIVTWFSLIFFRE